MPTATAAVTHIGCLVMNVALGADGKAFQKKQEQFLASNGMEWTCQRAKAIWNIALLSRNNDRNAMRKLCQENAIAYNKHTGIPKGIEGRVVKRFMVAMQPKVLKRLAAALRWYTSLTLKEITPKQSKKAISAIADPSQSRLSKGVTYDLGFKAISKYFPSEWERGNRERMQPVIADAVKLRANSYYYSRNKVPKSVKGEPYSSMAMSLMTEPWVPETLHETTSCKELRDFIYETFITEGHDQAFIGKIGFIQEQGCKLRTVFMPSAFLQLAFVPLHDYLMAASERMFPLESCVKDQELGGYSILAHMCNGHSVYCTDLSSATDRFPIEFSLGVLDSMGLQRWSSALREVVSKKVQCSLLPEGIQYAVGQPMGLKGSFPLFHISNMVLAKATELVVASKQDVTTFPDGSCFKVVGDDVIFSDKTISETYRSVMTDMGVSISESKSFHGNVAEFAGFVGLRTNLGVTVFKPYKVPDKDWVTNPIQFMDALGLTCSKVNSYWKRQFAKYQKTIGSRNLNLEPYFSLSDDRPQGPKYEFLNGGTRYVQTYRGDNQTIKNLCNVISMTTDEALPDLSGNTRINTVPLFQERGMFDWYGYSAEHMKTLSDEEYLHPKRLSAPKLKEDPLIRMVEEGQPLPNQLVSTRDCSFYEEDDPLERSSNKIINRIRALQEGNQRLRSMVRNKDRDDTLEKQLEASCNRDL